MAGVIPKSTTLVEFFWHQDAVDHKNPDKLIGKRFVHIKSQALYVVTGAFFNATSDKWCVSYDRLDDTQRREFSFTRDLDQFLDGRFLEVK